MTLAQYQEVVTPLMQKLVAFARKNKKYFYHADFNRVLLANFDEATAINFGWWEHLDEAGRREHMVKDWEKDLGVTPVQMVPAPLQQEYNDMIAALREFMPAKRMEPSRWSTESLHKDDVKSNKRIVKAGLSDGLYSDLIESGVMTIEQLQDVLDSLGVRMPKSLEAQVKEARQRLQFQSNPVAAEFMAMLQETYQQNVENYHSNMLQNFRNQIRRYLEAANSPDRKNMSDAESMLSANLLANWYRLFKNSKETVASFIKRDVVVLVADHEYQLNEIVDYCIGKLQEQLLFAMACKLEMVLSKLVSVEKISLVVSDMGLEGSFKFTLENGSFVIETKAIFAEGEINRAHFRYIAHYKNVVKDGKPYGTQNFEQMTNLFGQIY